MIYALGLGQGRTPQAIIFSSGVQACHLTTCCPLERIMPPH